MLFCFLLAAFFYLRGRSLPFYAKEEKEAEKAKDAKEEPGFQ